MKVRIVRFVILCFVSIAYSSIGVAQGVGFDTQQRPPFQDIGAWSNRLEDPARDQTQKPDQVVAALRLAKNAVVADIGSGTGYFTVRLARAVPEGRVYGADSEPKMVQYLRERGSAEGLTNMVSVQATRADPALPEPVDLALIVNVQSMVKNPEDYFRRLRTNLKPGGQVAMIAYRPEAVTGSPLAMRVPAEQVKRDMAQQGYALAAEHDFLPDQYFLVFRSQ
ncbi:MAG: class I SAM-dependent methyltransferase [Proteobacteria bacterium]|nr:class I SAM-dependent methyltransferase [Pseudomonadota bacterium]